MSIESEVAARFLKNVSEHQIEVIKDDGVHRHLRFKAPNTRAYWFELVTWPNRLVITGDMGTYVFARQEDMFEFFGRPDNGINASYWAEKLIAVDENIPPSEFCAQKARVIFADAIGDWPAEAQSLAFAELDDASYDNVEDFCRFVGEMKIDCDGKTYEVDDIWDWAHTLEDWTIHFMWNLHAIAWGIAQYDKRPVDLAPCKN